MRMTYGEKLEAKIDRFLVELTNESEVFGLIGKGYPGSFYKVYARLARDTKTWWKFEWSAGPSKLDPIKYQAELTVSERATAVWAPLTHLVKFAHDPKREALAKLFARAAELQREEAA